MSFIIACIFLVDIVLLILAIFFVKLTSIGHVLYKNASYIELGNFKFAKIVLLYSARKD